MMNILKCLLWKLLMVSPCILIGQPDVCYRSYSLNEFAKTHFVDSSTFYKKFYEEWRYPGAARENGMEGIYDVLLINHSDSSFETYILNENVPYLERDLHETFLRTRKLWLGKDLQFIVRFCVEYELLYRGEKNQKYKSKCGLKQTGYTDAEFRDSTFIYNAREIAKFPRVRDNAGFYKPQYYKVSGYEQSIEDIIESVIKKCNQRSVKLTHYMPPPPHSQPTGGKRKRRDLVDKGSIGIVIDNKGQIRNFYVYGKLKDKLDATKLQSCLNNVSFWPALNHKGISVNAGLDYNAQ